MHALKLSRRHAQEIIAHAREDAPNECCGVLAGNGDTVSQVYRSTNVDHSPVKYTIDPHHMTQIFDEADEAGLEVLAFYHSHTFTEAYPSVTDIKLAPPTDLFDYLYVIVSLADRDNPVIRAYRITGQQVGEVPLQIGG